MENHKVAQIRTRLNYSPNTHFILWRDLHLLFSAASQPSPLLSYDLTFATWSPSREVAQAVESE